jgi:hypothetical protein
MAVLILAHQSDATAYRVAAAARRLAGADVCVVSPADLACGATWRHVLRPNKSGLDAETRIALRDGRVIDSHEVTGVLNRIEFVEVPQFAQSREADQAYATMEIHALLLSWLASLRCPLVNPVALHTFEGDERSVVRWRVLAGRVGLPAAGLRLTTSVRRYPASGMVPCDHAVAPNSGASAARLPRARSHAVLTDQVGSQEESALVVGDATWGELPSALLAGARRLARAAGVYVLRVHFVSSADERAWLLADADPLPEVRELAPVSAIAEALCTRDRLLVGA